MTYRVSDAELLEIEKAAEDAKGHPLLLLGGGPETPQTRFMRLANEQAPFLVAEIRRLRSILDGIYDLVQETKGREDQLAALEQEVMEIRTERNIER